MGNRQTRYNNQRNILNKEKLEGSQQSAHSVASSVVIFEFGSTFLITICLEYLLFFKVLFSHLYNYVYFSKPEISAFINQPGQCLILYV